MTDDQEELCTDWREPANPNKIVRVAGVSVDNETDISKWRFLSLEFGRCRDLVRAAGHGELSPDMSDVTRTAELVLRKAT